MALAAGLAMGAAVASGAAVGIACSIQFRGEAERLSRQQPPVTDSQQQGQPAYRPDPVVPNRDPANIDSQKTSKSQAELGRRAPLPRRGNSGPEEDPEEIIGGWEGFSMEEARAAADQAQSKAMARTPVQVLTELQRGNARFWMNCATRPECSAFERRGLISKQFPSVAILGCSDSRVPVEIVFDQGLGDIFVIRVAGNALETSTLGSLQYAVHHLNVKVVMVLGHEMCGAVKAAMLPREKLEQEPAELEQFLKSMKVGLGQDRFDNLNDARAVDREAVTSNVRRQVERLTRDEGIMAKVRQREVMIVGAFYEISSGIVDFFFEVSEPEPEVSAAAVSTVASESPSSRSASKQAEVDDSPGELMARQPSRGVMSRFQPAPEAQPSGPVGVEYRRAVAYGAQQQVRIVQVLSPSLSTGARLGRF